MKRTYINRRKRLNPLKNIRYMKNKYNAKTQTCHQGHKHDSIGEANYCDMLFCAKKAKAIKDYRIQILYDLCVNGKKVTGHRVDFEVDTLDGKVEVHEFKGFATREWNIKRKLFEAVYPDIKYIVIH